MALRQVSWLASGSRAFSGPEGPNGIDTTATGEAYSCASARDSHTVPYYPKGFGPGLSTLQNYNKLTYRQRGFYQPDVDKFSGLKKE